MGSTPAPWVAQMQRLHRGPDRHNGQARPARPLRAARAGRIATLFIWLVALALLTVLLVQVFA